MATSAISSSTPTATTTAATSSTAAAASNKVNAQKILTSLNAGSGVDVTSLAQNLVDAERIPRENAINAKITKNESRVSGYSAISFMMSELNTALSALKDKNSFNVLGVSQSNANALSVTTAVGAQAGSYDVTVKTLAKPQRSLSNGMAGNLGADINVSISVGGVTSGIAITQGSTPSAIVSAINTANTGVTARLVDTGGATPYKIVLTGASGADKAFAVETVPTGILEFGDPLQPATDAEVTVDGVTYTRKTNTITDIVPGLTLGLKTEGSTTSIALARDTTSLKDKVNAVVTAYNDASNILKEVSDPKSTLDTYGATLVGDSTVRMVHQQLRNLMLGTSATPGASVSALWQMGLSIDETGKMSADASKLDAALTDHFDDVVLSLTGNQNNQPPTSTTSGGLFGDAVKKITSMIAKSGPLLTQSLNATNQNTRYKEDLTKLQTRMDSLLTRYTKQFAAMESLVGQVNSQKTSLKSSFEGMMAMYTKN